MSLDALPQLTLNTIQSRSTPQVYERGDRYYQSGAISNPMRRQWKFWADCKGTEIYHPSVTFSTQGMTETRCTCRYHGDGLCKHLVAMLLTYVHHPEVFEDVTALTAQLADSTPADLIALIEQMVERHPDLVAVIELAAAKPAEQPLIDVTLYQRQAQRALWREQANDIVADLQPLLQSAAQLQQAGNWLNAGLIYQTLLAEMNARYDHDLFSMDYNGEIAALVEAFVTGLGQCLDHVQDEALRDDWLMTLLSCVFKELELGGVDYAYEAVDYLLSAATPEEWNRLEALIRDEIPRSDRWEQETLASILSRRQEAVGTSHNS